MEELKFDYPAHRKFGKRVHLGVVASGDLEVMMVPSPDGRAHVTVQTSVSGFEKTWKAVLDRFFERYGEAVQLDIHDFGATPGTVALRLRQAAEESAT